MNNTAKYINARAKAFTGQRVREHSFQVLGREVRVWDSVANHYTRCHAMSRAAERRIIALSQEGGK